GDRNPRPGGRYPPPLLRGARTFLAGIAPAAAARPPGERLSSPSAVAIQEQREQHCPDLQIDPAVDQFRPPAALERAHRRLAIGYVVAVAFEREEERTVVLERIAESHG